MIVLADVIKKRHLIDQVDLYTNKKGNLSNLGSLIYKFGV